MSQTSRRVVVTGMGALTPVGNSRDEYWRSLLSGKSGAGPITRFPTAGFSTTIAAELKGFDPTVRISAKEARRMDPFIQYAVYATYEALEDSGLRLDSLDPTRAGVIVGSGIGGISTLEAQYNVLKERGPGRVSPFMIPMLISDMAAGMISITFGFKGPNYCTVSACASAAHALGDAVATVRRGQADVVVAGGTEASLTELAMAGFCAARALSTRNDDPDHASRPFDKERDGFVCGEGAGILVLEDADHATRRGARIYAEVLGFGYSADAYHITAPPADGDGMARCMANALTDAGISRERVGYVNAHGTSTEVGDAAETAAIKRVFGDRASKLAVSSTKSMTGHLLGAAGAIESIAAILAISEGAVPPTINYATPDPACDLDYVPNTAREVRLDVAMSNSFGFGGHNASLVFAAWNG